MKNILGWIFISLQICFISCQRQTNSPDIAVVGGGIAGASAAYFLSKMFSTPQFDANIHVYEGRNIGGRLHTIEVGGYEYEAGGSVIHSKNKYMVDFVKTLGLNYQAVSGDLFGLYNGKDYVFKESEWHFITLLKMFWRYGKDIYRLKSLVDNMIERLSRIYTYQNKGLAYTSVEKMMNAMDDTFVNLTSDSIDNILRSEGYGELLISELTEAAMRTNYGQSGKTLHGFVGLVSVAGIGYELWHVKEGNYRVPELLLKRSNAYVIRKNVTVVQLTPEKEYSLIDSDGNVQNYDIVVIATPLTKDLCNIKFSGFSEPIAPVHGTFHRTVATFVQGKRNLSTINLKDAKIESVLTMDGVKLFNSFSINSPINSKKNEKHKSVYKIFSQNPLTERELDDLFTERHETKVVDWLAYPEYKIPQPLGKFVLNEPGLYYTNAIEFSASAMEMSAISGRNAALLAYNKWHGKHSNIDFMERSKQKVKNELRK